MLPSNRTGRHFNPFGVEFGKITETQEDKAYWAGISTKELPKKTAEHANLKLRHRKATEGAFACALVITVVGMFGLRSSGFDTRQFDMTQTILQVEQIPVTRQEHRPPPPARPAVPIPTDDDMIPDEETIDATTFDLADIPPPPPPPEISDEDDIFIAYDVAPEPVNGWSELYKSLEYPMMARKSGIEARLTVRVLIDTQGAVERAEILTSSVKDLGFEESALSAAKLMKWTPAKQRDKIVKVWVTFPVSFKLRASG